MATIEKRAEEYATEVVHTRAGEIAELNIVKYESYIEIATEQRKIDIEKACEWTCSQCPLRCKDVLTSGFVACSKHTDRTECKSLQLLIKALEE